MIPTRKHNRNKNVVTNDAPNMLATKKAEQTY